MRKYLTELTKKSILIIVFYMLLLANSYAQYVQDYKKSADLYYTKADYYSAAVYYEKYLETKSGGAKTLSNKPYSISDKSSNKQKSELNFKADDAIIMAKLAESYRLINDFGNAEKWYANALKSKSYNVSDTQYWYAVTLRANAKYSEAKQAFEQYLTLKTENKLFVEQAKLDLKNTQFALDQTNKKDLDLYQIVKLEDLNTEGANYAASVSSDVLIFTSTRANSELLDKSKTYKNALYISMPNDNSFSSVKKLNIANLKDMEQGVASINSAGNKLYITRWTKTGKENKVAIYFSENKNDQWTEPTKLSEQVNVEGYNSQQPFITADDKYLIFSSNRPGGQGKFDLWISELDENGLPTSANNLGNLINTTEDEQAPFYHQASNTLVFSSKGGVGLGGFDFFESKGNVATGWSASENMGYPVNSSKDDLYFSNTSNSELLTHAIISSDRASACCLELFSLTKVEPPQVVTLEKQPEPIIVEEKSVAKNAVEQKAYFEFDKTKLNTETIKILDKLTDILKAQENFGLEIIGYTDNKGTDEYNQKLSEARAKVCKDYLVKAGVSASKIKIEGKGKTIASGDDAKDRKTEFRIMLLN